MKLFRDLTVACLSVLLGLTILLTACDSEAVQSGADDTTLGTSVTLPTPDQTTTSVTEPSPIVPATTTTATATVTTVPVTTQSVSTTAPTTAPDIPDITDPPQNPDATEPEVTTPTPPATEPTPEVCTHEYVQTVVDATCTEEGKKTYACPKCGDSYWEVIEKAAHAYADATCVLPKTCTACGVTDGEALGHSYALVNTEDATCTQEGKKVYTCSKCGDSYSETIAKLAHNYADATCTAPKTCKSCGATEGKANGHSHKLTSNTNATCTQEGKKVYTCSKCGDSYSETIAKLAHNYADATCTAPKTCKSCGATEGKANGHAWVIPTGAAQKHCSVCGTVAPNDSAEHKHTWQDATCDLPKTCVECGQTTGKALGHIWDFAACESLQRCSRCEGFGGSYVSHQWNSRSQCSVCYARQCEKYDHYFFYGRCYFCSAFDEETTDWAEQVIDQIVRPGMSEYDKVKAIHDYIINTTQYDVDGLESGDFAETSFSAVGVFVYGKAVCQGYAYAFELLCELVGIECEYVTGFGNGGDHGWNQVKVDGVWYNIDLTWDDPIFKYNGVIAPMLRYDYFLISDSQMYQDHCADGAKHACAQSYCDHEWKQQPNGNWISNVCTHCKLPDYIVDWDSLS